MEDQNYFPSVEFLGFIFDFWHIEEYILGAVHILRQPKSGVHGPPLPPPSAMVSIWLAAPFILKFAT